MLFIDYLMFNHCCSLNDYEYVPTLQIATGITDPEAKLLLSDKPTLKSREIVA